MRAEHALSQGCTLAAESQPSNVKRSCSESGAVFKAPRSLMSDSF